MNLRWNYCELCKTPFKIDQVVYVALSARYIQDHPSYRLSLSESPHFCENCGPNLMKTTVDNIVEDILHLSQS